MENSYISVVIPTYKCPDALDLCLQSAIEGQQNNNQIIVVVDGFYDINKDVLDKWSKHIDVLTLQENLGLCRGTNLGVYNAKHDKILIVNDDNVFPRFWDTTLLEEWKTISDEYKHDNIVITPNQVEPYPSMFNQFIIKDLGRTIADFNLEKFWLFDYHYASGDKHEACGSTLPIFMKRIDYLRLGGWDENYEMGMVADWDFFLKCQLSGLQMMRTWACHFYHFVSLTTSTPETIQRRNESEYAGHEYAKYKWGTYIQHDPITNLKFLQNA